MSALSQQPLSVTIQAVQAIFQNTGTVTSYCGNNLAMEFLQPVTTLLQASRAVYCHEAHRYSVRE